MSAAIRVMLDADPDRAEVRALRCAIAMRIEADIALLDRLGGDPDLEDGHDAEGSAAEWTGRGAHRFNVGEAA